MEFKGVGFLFHVICYRSIKLRRGCLNWLMEVENALLQRRTGMARGYGGTDWG